MSVHGPAPFENDDATEAVHAFVDRGLPGLVPLLDSVANAGRRYLEADECRVALAAAAIVGAANGRGVRVPDDVREKIQDTGPPTKQHLRLACKAVERVLVDSELKDLWGERGGTAWRRTTTALLRHLRAPQDQRAPLPRPAKKIVPGTILSVPLAKGCWATCKVLHVSSVFRNVVLVGVFPGSSKKGKAAGSLPDSYCGLVYTTKDNVVGGKWQAVGVAEVSEADVALSLRLVGDDVWCADKKLRRATRKDRDAIDDMTVSYNPEDEMKLLLGLESRASLTYKNALELIAEKDYSEAINYLNVVIEEEPNFALAYWARHRAHRLAGDAEGAELDRKQAIKLDPSLGKK